MKSWHCSCCVVVGDNVLSLYIVEVVLALPDGVNPNSFGADHDHDHDSYPDYHHCLPIMSGKGTSSMPMQPPK